MTNEILKNEMVNTSGETWKEKFFTTTGTIDRMTFFKRSLILLGAELLLIFAIGFVGILASIIAGSGDPSTMADVIVAIVLLASLFPDYCLNVKRLRDIGKDETLAKIFVGVGILSVVCNFAAVGTIAYSVANVLAIVSLIFTSYLLFTKGNN